MQKIRVLIKERGFGRGHCLMSTPMRPVEPPESLIRSRANSSVELPVRAIIQTGWGRISDLKELLSDPVKDQL
jgi:hypothetical protein